MDPHGVDRRVCRRRGARRVGRAIGRQPLPRTSPVQGHRRPLGAGDLAGRRPRRWRHQRVHVEGVHGVLLPAPGPLCRRGHRAARRRVDVALDSRRRRRERTSGDPRGTGDGRRLARRRGAPRVRPAGVRRTPVGARHGRRAFDGRVAHRRRGPTLPRRALPSRQHGGRRRRRGGHRRDPPRRRPGVRGVPVRRRDDPAVGTVRDRPRHDDPRRHRTGAPHRRWPCAAAARPRPRGARRRRPCARRWIVEPVVRRDPRASRSRLQRVLGHCVVLRLRRVVDLRRDDATSTRRRCVR